MLSFEGTQSGITYPAEEHGLCWKLISLQEIVPDILLYYFPCVLGRKGDAVDYVISSDGVSRRHAMIFISGENLYVEDLGSTNGTYVNQVRLSPGSPMQLAEGTVLRLGPNRYKIEKNE